jgi:SAM-dependent methyltransferase
MAGRLVGGNVTFDHAADTYDETRALPEPIARALTAALLAEIERAGAARVLEVGAGTGRIARPLAERGVRVVGVDIAPRMLARLREQLTPAHTPPDLALADATRLPFSNGAVRAVIMVHVLHLVSSWAAALDETRRVLAPGGVFLHPVADYGEDNPWQAGLATRQEILHSLGVTPRARPGPEDIGRRLRDLGASLRTVGYAHGRERGSPAEWLERTRQRTDSWSWEVPEAVFPEFIERYERWNREHYGDLDRQIVQEVEYRIDVWRFG